MQKTTAPYEAIGQSEVFLQFQERLSRVAPVNRPVLLMGERGTGKELAAVRLHYLSQRWDAPFVTLNCAALTPSLIESELFGYEKGAFTDARQRRIGRFETANDGTLFLDEIATIPMEVQEKILRVVEYGSFERVGGTDSIDVDVRIIGATNADLGALADEGRFKRDLMDRLSFEVLFVPPLRERKGDILYLAEYFSRQMAYELGRESLPKLSDKAIRDLELYSWNGNIRELKNVVERAVYQSDSNWINNIVFNPFQSPFDPPASTGTKENSQKIMSDDGLTSEIFYGPLKDAVDRLKMYRIGRALSEARYNRKKAACFLGLTYDQLRGLERKFGEKIKGSSE